MDQNGGPGGSASKPPKADKERVPGQEPQEGEVVVAADEVAEMIEVGEEDVQGHMDEEEDGPNFEDEDSGDEEDEEKTRRQDQASGFYQHTGAVYSVSFSHDNSMAITGGGDDRACVWRVADGQLIWESEGHKDSVVAASFSNDDMYVASASMDGDVAVWKRNDDGAGKPYAPLVRLEAGSDIEWMQWHPKGPVLLAGCADGSAWMWSIPSGNVANVFAGAQAERSTDGGFSWDGKGLATTSEDGTLVIWDPRSAQPLQRVTGEDTRFHTEALTCMAWSMDNTLIVSGSTDRSVVVTTVQSGKIAHKFDEGHTDVVNTVGFSAKQHALVASGGMDGHVCIWDLTHSRLRRILDHPKGVIRLLWHPTEPLLYTACIDRRIRVYDARTGDLKRTFEGHQARPLDMRISNDGSLIGSSGDDMAALVFSLQ
eukprot:Clim_evm107s128 gene=Clim_evmTU107s128